MASTAPGDKPPNRSADSDHDPGSTQEKSYTPLDPAAAAMLKNPLSPTHSADIDAIGSQCQLAECHVLDFLPFRCESCSGVFCLDHRTETAHHCSQPGAWARRRAEALRAQEERPSKAAVRRAEAARRLREGPPLPTECSSGGCREKINTGLKQGVQCDNCTKWFCLKHRMQEDHECKRPESVQQTLNRSMKQDIMDKFKKWKASRTTKMLPAGDGKRKKGGQAAARTKFLIDLKKEAKGDAKIPQEKRLYLVVEAQAISMDETVTEPAKIPSRQMFVNKEWSAGRVLDVAARELGVENRNNLGGGIVEKLHVYHVQSGEILPYSTPVGGRVELGDTLVLLRGIDGLDGA